MTRCIETSRDDQVLRLTFNRPDTANALDEPMIADLTDAFAEAARDPRVRVVVLAARGDTFCAGTDVTWMELAARGRGADDLFRLGALLQQMRACAKPIVAVAQGPAIGAGAALLACADVAIADDETYAQFPALRLGAVPAVIGPYVIEAMGLRQARRYFLTGERMPMEAARRFGLVHMICLGAHLDRAANGVIGDLLLAGPGAMREAKSLLALHGNAPPSPSLLKEAARKSTEVRRSDEGREGLAAFIERRAPAWLPNED